ncbi:MAG TPA: ATP-binding protein [Bacteroidota bacterium]|nr:ATP-binding protein [Bacteroidota bacterium]
MAGTTGDGEMYRTIVERSLDAIIILQDEHPVYANPAAVRLFGYRSMEQILEVKFVDLIAPGSRPFTLLRPERHTVGEQLLQSHEVRGLNQQGMVIDLEMNALATSWAGRPAIQTSFRDISKRKNLEKEQALWLWEQETLTKIDRQLVAIVDLQKILTAITEHAKLLTRADFAAVMMTDLNTKTYGWRAMMGNIHPWIQESLPLSPFQQEMLKKRERLIVNDFRRTFEYPPEEFPIIQKEEIKSFVGLPLHVEDSMQGILVVGFRRRREFQEREIRLLTSLADKSSLALSNARLYDHLVEREHELELLSGASVKAQEDERRRIAREIHDGLGQLLTAIKFNLEILEDSFKPEEDERKRVDDMKRLLDSVMKEARELSYNLMPSVLDDFGLSPALQLLCEQFSHQTSIPISFHVQNFSDRLEPMVEIGLYRIAQEALNNAAKHAAASEINVQLARLGEGLLLTVEDNGRGIPERAGAPRHEKPPGMGLVSMRERAASFNGRLTISSVPGKGTTVEAFFPLRKTAEEVKS